MKVAAHFEKQWREAGYPTGFRIALIAPEDLSVQATVIGKMLEQVGFTVERQMLDPTVYNQKTRLDTLDQPAEQQAWDIALTSWSDGANFPAIQPYHLFALDGPYDWVIEESELQRLYAQVLRTVDREQQQALEDLRRKVRDTGIAIDEGTHAAVTS